MSELTRRDFLAGTATLAAGAITSPALAQTPRRGGTLRFIPIGDLKILDPIWTTAYITRDHAYMIWDTLFATDANLQIKPQMVDKYTVSRDGLKYSFTLRDGLRFHDGQPVTAEDCVVSLIRWGKKDPLGKLMFGATGKLQATDKKTFVLELKEPFGQVLEALGKPSSNVPFIMPARLAALPADEQVKEPIGSGPFKFVKEEWQPGNQVVYARNADYVPRSDPPSGAAGGKHVYLDRVIWRYMPDSATAASALEAGELDYWQFPPADFAAKLGRNPNITTFIADPVGLTGWLRPNHLHPPFNNRKARQALLYMVDQEMYLQAAIGQPKYYRTCPGIFFCGNVPYESKAGAPRSRPRPPAHEGIGLRRPAGGRPRSDRPSRAARRRPRDARAARQDRCHRRPAGRGLEHPAVAPGQEGSAQLGWLESVLDQLDLVRRAEPRGQRRRGRRRREWLVRLVLESADREAPPRLDPRHRSRQAQADRRADPGNGLRGGAVRTLGPVRPALIHSQERAWGSAIPRGPAVERVARCVGV
jgi:Bacterial extracellular solute-binding proteins, family 5 Middle